jgi:acyl-coenzyme A synthetase/AMP-(fatty) acid ligase
MLIEEGLMQMGSTMNGEVEPYVDPNVHRPGFRHLPMLVDYYATYTPSKVWASIPIDQSDLSAGFRDVSYGEFNNAISYYAHWLAKALVNTEDFETVAYTGPRDIRYPILAMAIAKLQRKLLLPSPTATPAAQAYLVRKLECKTFLYGGGFGDVAHGVAANVEEWKVKALKVPELEACLKEQTVEPVEWRKSWEEARHLPWIVVHTSGSTGLPKPIVHTHQMMTTFEATELMLDASDDSLMKHMDGRRCYSPLATLHVGILSTASPMTC